jgi:hypothetical protein
MEEPGLKEKSVMKLAFKDISNHIRCLKLKIVDEKGDVWVVTPNALNTKDIRKLNKKLGLHKINKSNQL